MSPSTEATRTNSKRKNEKTYKKNKNKPTGNPRILSTRSRMTNGVAINDKNPYKNERVG